MTRLLELECRLCGTTIPDDRAAVGTCPECTIREMIESRTAPMGRGFEPFVCENLYKEPVIVKSPGHFKDLQRLAGCVHVGDDGQKEHVRQAVERSNENIKEREAFERSVRTYKGTLPPGFGKKKPFDPVLEARTRRRHDQRPDPACGSYRDGDRPIYPARGA